MRLWQELEPCVPKLEHYTISSFADIRLKALWARGWQAVHTHGWKLPAVAVKKIAKRLGSEGGQP